MTRRGGARRELDLLLKDHPQEEQAFFKKAAQDAAIEASAVAGGHSRRAAASGLRMLPNMFGAVDGEAENTKGSKRGRDGRGGDDDADSSGPSWDRFYCETTGTWAWLRRQETSRHDRVLPAVGDEATIGMEVISPDAITLSPDDYLTCSLGDTCLQPRPLDVEFGPSSTGKIFELVAVMGWSNFVAVFDRLTSASNGEGGEVLADARGLAIATVADVAFRFWAVSRRVVARRKEQLLRTLEKVKHSCPAPLAASLRQLAESSPVARSLAASPLTYVDYNIEVERRCELLRIVSALASTNVVLEGHIALRDDWKTRLEHCTNRHSHPELSAMSALRHIEAVERALPGICAFFRTGFGLRGHATHPCVPASYVQDHVLLSLSHHVPLVLREVEEALEKQLADHHAALASCNPQVVVKVERVRAALFRNMVLRQLLTRKKTLEAALTRLVDVEMDAAGRLKDDELP